MKDLFGEQINEPIRYLGWKQPYAQLMLYGKQETRTWHTNYRGLVLITASVGAYRPDELLRISGVEQLHRIELFLHSDWTTNKSILRGHAIAVRLVDCQPMLKEHEDVCFVEHKEGLWRHIYEDVVPIQPVPYKGAQGWRKVEPNFLHKIIPI